MPPVDKVDVAEKTTTTLYYPLPVKQQVNGEGRQEYKAHPLVDDDGGCIGGHDDDEAHQ